MLTSPNFTLLILLILLILVHYRLKFRRIQIHYTS